MGALGDWLGDTKYSIVLGAVFASLLVVQCAWNALRRPFAARLTQRNADDYHTAEAAAAGMTV